MFVCLSFIDYYTIHPIAMQLWAVVEYTLAKVSELVELLNSTPNGERGSKRVFYIASYIGIIGVSEFWRQHCHYYDIECPCIKQINK